MRVNEVIDGMAHEMRFSTEDFDRWRLVLDVAANAEATVELTTHVAGYGRILSETWLYQWMKS